jgi:hypothetical protein
MRFLHRKLKRRPCDRAFDRRTRARATFTSVCFSVVSAASLRGLWWWVGVCVRGRECEERWDMAHARGESGSAVARAPSRSRDT